MMNLQSACHIIGGALEMNNHTNNCVHRTSYDQAWVRSVNEDILGFYETRWIFKLLFKHPSMNEIEIISIWLKRA